MRIHPAVWRLCHTELDWYELYKKALADRKTEIIEEYQGRNQTVGRDNEEPQQTMIGGGSIYQTKMDAAIHKLTAEDIVDLEKRIERIDDVYRSLTLREQHFFDLHYGRHLPIVQVAKLMSYSRDPVNKIKHRIIEKTAIRLGYKLMNGREELSKDA